MNAAHSINHAAPESNAPLRAAEPSMEEILASIRRIIADDDALPLAPRPAPRLVIEPLAPVASPALILVAPTAQTPPPQVHHVPEEPAFDEQAFAATLAVDHGEAAEAAAEPEGPAHYEPQFAALHAQPAPAHAYDAPHAHELADPIVSSNTSLRVHASFENLAATLIAQNAAMVEESIRSMLRPMLKSWLDDNLPVIVEKLVRTEIERVARGGR